MNTLNTRSDLLNVNAQTAYVQNLTSNDYDHGPAPVPDALVTAMNTFLNTSSEDQATTVIQTLTSSLEAKNLVLSCTRFLTTVWYPLQGASYAQHFYYSQRPGLMDGRRRLQ